MASPNANTGRVISFEERNTLLDLCIKKIQQAKALNYKMRDEHQKRTRKSIDFLSLQADIESGLADIESLFDEVATIFDHSNSFAYGFELGVNKPWIQSIQFSTATNRIELHYAGLDINTMIYQRGILATGDIIQIKGTSSNNGFAKITAVSGANDTWFYTVDDADFDGVQADETSEGARIIYIGTDHVTS